MNRTVLKKLISALLILGILLGISACRKEPEIVETQPPATAPETTAPAETTEATTEPTETEPTEQHYTITLAGDCTLGYMPGHEYSYGGFKYIVGDDFEYPFRNVREYFENDDFTMVNFEGTLGDEGYPANKAFTFRGRAEYTSILTSSSVEAVTLANNHSLDYGIQGYNETKRLLDQAGVPYVEKDASTFFITRSGLKIGLYAASFVIDQKDLETEVAALREQGAEIVIFAIHWGSEGMYHSFVDQWNAAYKAIDAGVDIVYGHHPHVLQKIEEYNGGYIFYSLGNFSFGGNQAPVDMDTALIQLDVIRDLDGNVTLGEMTAVPCCISSVSGSNNYQPTPYRVGSDGYDRVMQKLSGTWKGNNVVPIYNTADDVTNPSTPAVPPTEPDESATTPTSPVTPPSGSEGGGETGGGEAGGGESGDAGNGTSGNEGGNSTGTEMPVPPPAPETPPAPDSGTGGGEDG